MLVLNPDGTFTYTPPEGYVGEDSFTYTTNDGQIGASSGPATVTIKITNDLPDLNNDTGTTHMGDTLSNIDVLGNDSDLNGDLFSVNSYDYSGSGILVLNPDGTFTYTPPDGYVGEDSFTYTISDGQIGASSEPATVTIMITNNLPDLTNDLASTHMGDTLNNINVLGNDTDLNGDPFTVDSFSYTGSGTLVKNPDGTFTYTPPDGYVGTDSFTYTTSDGEIGKSSGPATVTLNITNTLPKLSNDTVITIKNNPVSGINVLANDKDFDGDTLLLTSFTYSGGGTLILNPNGTFTYTPPADFIGTESFSYEVTDGQLDKYVSAIVNIIVNDDTLRRLPSPEEAESVQPPSTPELNNIGQIEGAQFGNLVWLAQELGLCEGDQWGEDQTQCQELTQAYLAGAFFQATDVNPYRAAARLRTLVEILHDEDGSHITALNQVVSEFIQTPVPPSDEQMAAIVATFKEHVNDGTHYAAAGQWLDALTEYVDILSTDIGWPTDESIAFVMGKYGTTVTETGNISVIAFIQMHLEGISG
jgi:hypothetical protein